MSPVTADRAERCLTSKSRLFVVSSTRKPPSIERIEIGDCRIDLRELIEWCDLLGGEPDNCVEAGFARPIFVIWGDDSSIAQLHVTPAHRIWYNSTPRCNRAGQSRHRVEANRWHRSKWEQLLLTEYDWQSFLARWDGDAMGVHVRGLRRGGIAEPAKGGRRSALLQIAQQLGTEIPASLFEPLGEGSSDADVVAEAQRRIAAIEALLLPGLRAHRPNAKLFDDDYHWAVIRNGRHFHAPAEEAVIVAAEKRLGRTLPASYREFLRISNGWITISSCITPIESTGWLRDKGPSWIENFGGANEFNREASLRWHAIYGKEQDPPRYHRAYLQECLQLSEPLVEANCVFLLNPAAVFEDDEWESWFLASWLAGARRYKSFYELMDWMRATDLRELGKAEADGNAPR